MRYLDLTLPSPAENLALDEALLEEAESRGQPTETLRFWEPPQVMAVVGRSSKIERELHAAGCRKLDVPMLRRISGGAAILTGPGCLMYAVVLSLRLRGGLHAVDRTHQFVLGTLAAALEPLVPGVCCSGISDLAIDGRKFSGNSVRMRRNHLLYHGTLLYDFPLELIGRCIAMPPRQPDYRNGRTHDAFLTNLPLEAAAIRQALATAFGATEPCPDWPRECTARLAVEKYCGRRWNEQL